MEGEVQGGQTPKQESTDLPRQDEREAGPLADTGDEVGGGIKKGDARAGTAFSTGRDLSAVRPEDFATGVSRQQFSLGVVAGSLALVLRTGTSLKRAGMVLALNWGWWGHRGAVGSYWSVRLWLLRLGLYQLQRPLERADDWMWIIDHTMQLGERKCSIIVGLRQSAWNAKDRCLSHEDVEVIDLEPVTSSTGERVYQQLEAAAARTGVPRAIVSDGGRDLRKGVNQFREGHPDTVWLYDVKHKTACLLKHELERDKAWQAFVGEVNQFKQRVSVTPLACLLPPQQRGKARYLNIDVLVAWAEEKLRLLDSPAVQAVAELEATVVEEKLGWLRGFAADIRGWREVLDVLECTEHYVRHQGIHPLATAEFGSLLPHPTSAMACRLRTELLEFIQAEAEQARAGERLLGSSEVLESIIGKYKRVAGERGQHGLTGMVLSLGAIVGRITVDTVQAALETVPCQDVWNWCHDHLGTSLQGQRLRITQALKREQKEKTPCPAET